MKSLPVSEHLTVVYDERGLAPVYAIITSKDGTTTTTIPFEDNPLALALFHSVRGFIEKAPMTPEGYNTAAPAGRIRRGAAPPPVGSLWKHKKTGHVYVVIGHCQIEATNQPGVLYTPVWATSAPTVWARPTLQFMDGRFETWAAPT